MKYKDVTIFSLVLGVCFIGVVAGMIVAKRQELRLGDVRAAVEFTRLTNQGVYEIFLKGLMHNLPWFAAFSILGFWGIGIFFNVCLLFYKGFAAGLCAMYLCVALGFKGIAIGIIGVMLPAIVLLLLYSYIVCSSIFDKIGGSRLRAVHDKGYFSKTAICVFVFTLCVYLQSLVQYLAFYKF